MARRRGVGIADGFAAGDAELLADQVDAGHLLGDRVLHLQPGVDLQEGDDSVLAYEELAGAGASVAGLLQDGFGRAHHLGVLLTGQERCRRLLNQLLVAPLQRAVSGRHDDDVAVVVGQALGLDVARLVQVALDEALAAAECGDRLAGGGVEQLGDLLHGACDFHPSAAAAEDRLDGDRETVLLGEGHDLFAALHRVGGAGDHVCVRLGGDMAGLDLVAQGLDRFGGWADPDQPGVENCLGERGILGQEPIAGVNRVCAGFDGDGQKLLLHQVGVARSRPAKGVGLVRNFDVQRVTVRVGVNGNRSNPAVLACTSDTDGDLAAVCDQHFADGRHNLRSLALDAATSNVTRRTHRRGCVDPADST